ncbi:aerobic-type carbon monoxide dehydrogenase, large subunit CoxL/CutL-like protein [Desulfosporosinus orientis DSM 765]|uniref:Aerobic-type carbon monoxide dehydrogenase, large subunit CoxL/CutL-like protein n=1 Tax=Desulfosporosinus orientis (strain ATCC 19365 / DSM 765 / NCIMB 8382 / VKM B-1628 / Singapore I) TaxID=768706 RepID=G7W8S9_DESOD|nr:molybdopterin cofactor-binding domain-containing protein [Desulfosporosinus orientis]AET67789.1 aerobic-type carbon monoxide dehydrogenase, large subunit CoxL/CutL-like protein [Desulfosporosinus orientis DSM 765]
MDNSLKYVGHTFPIHDAPQKVKGSLVYLSDIKLPEMLYAKLLLSPIAHGKIKQIDTTRAEALPGVIKVFTHLNTPNKTFSRYRIVPNQDYCFEDERLLTDKVRFVGDRVAAVVATSKAVAKEALALIQVEYEELPVLSTPQQALENPEIRIHPGGNLLHEYDLILGEKVPIAGDCLEAETLITTQKVHHAAMETHVCLADFDSFGKLTIWAACQGAFGIRTIVADLLNLSYHKVRVIKVPMGGSFGGRQEAVLEPLTAFLAKEVRHPVKLSFTREESIITTMTRPATSSKIRTIVSKEGILKEFSVETIVDAGAYATSSVDNTYVMSKKIGRLYRIPYYRHTGKTVYTNTPIAGGARGWGAPEIITAAEIHMDAAARQLKMDPFDIRLKNLVHPYDEDKATQYSLGNARVIECLEKGAEAFGWHERFNGDPGQGRFRKGVGLACAAHKNGMFGGFPEHSTMILKMNEDGSFILNTGLHELGCGTITSMIQITAEVLDVDPSRITVLEADTEYGPYDFGSYGSRVTYICGACAFEAAKGLKEIILDCAAYILQKPKQYLRVKNGQVWELGNEEKALTYREIASTAKVKNNTDIIITHTYHGTSNPGVYAVHFAEVEVDTATGQVQVLDYLAAHDIGKAINPGMVEGQIQGGVQMGIGYALYEEIQIGKNGRILTNGLKNYHVVNAPDMPEVKTLLIEEGGDEGPYGAKSIGEIALVPVAAAIVNAVNHALNTSLSNLPLTPEKILAALK